MKVLLVSDLHYDLRKLDWVVEQARSHDLVAVGGDLLNIASPVPLDVQIGVVLQYLRRMAVSTRVVVCSGNHDLDSLTESGEKATSWLAEAREDGVLVDGDTGTVDGWQVTACAWWEGPVTLARLHAALAAAPRGDRWMWVWHGPPSGPLAWTGSKEFADPELPALLAQHSPDLVLCGHIHQAPFTPDGAWSQQVGHTWLFNAGHQRGPVPAAVTIDTDTMAAAWSTAEGHEDLVLAALAE